MYENYVLTMGGQALILYCIVTVQIIVPTSFLQSKHNFSMNCYLNTILLIFVYVQVPLTRAVMMRQLAGHHLPLQQQPVVSCKASFVQHCIKCILAWNSMHYYDD